MKKSRVSYRYAKALLQSASALGKSEDVAKDMHYLQTVLDQSAELRAYLQSPIIKHTTKRETLAQLFSKTISPITMNFLTLLANRRRESELADIIDAFTELHDAQRGIARVEVVSAVELSDTQKSAILEKVSALSKKILHASYKIDSSIIGGFIVQLGDTMYDASIRRQLELMKHAIESGSVSSN